MYLQQLAALPHGATAVPGLGTGGSRRSASALEEELSALDVTPRGALVARQGASITGGRQGATVAGRVQVVPPKRGGAAKGFGGAKEAGEVLPVEFRDLNTTEAAGGAGQGKEGPEAWDAQAVAADVMAAFAQAEAGLSGQAAASDSPAAGAQAAPAAAAAAGAPKVQVDVRSTRGEAKGGRAPFKRRRQEGQQGRAPAPGPSTMAATAELLQSLGMQGLPRVPSGAAGQQQGQQQRQQVEVEVEMDGGAAAASVASAWAATNGGGGGGARMDPEDPRTWNLLDEQLGRGPGGAGGGPIEVVEPEVVEP